MKHLFISYELALKLKEKGFDDPCLASFYGKEKSITFHQDYKNRVYLGKVNNSDFTLAPLYQQVVDWFRDKYNIHINVSFENWSDAVQSFEYTCNLVYQSECLSIKEKTYKYTDKTKQHIRRTDNPHLYFTSYYEALTKAIEEALKLIKND